MTEPNTPIILSELGPRRPQPFLMIKNLISCVGCPIYELVLPAPCLMRSKYLRAEFCVVWAGFHIPVCWSAFPPTIPLSYTPCGLYPKRQPC